MIGEAKLFAGLALGGFWNREGHPHPFARMTRARRLIDLVLKTWLASRA
jgi:hypothetical protein